MTKKVLISTSLASTQWLMLCAPGFCQTGTAQNQSKERSDIRLSATLRRKIMHKKSLSFDAQNIKIISENGSLVLRGPVKTAEEKQVIDSMARKCCKTMPYKNELEVKNQ